MTRVCPNCGQANPPDAAFCLNCATPLSPQFGGGPAYQQQSPPYAGGHGSYVGGPAQPYVGGEDFGTRPQGAAGSASGRAIGSAILAAATLILCCGPFTGIPAAILGWLELEAIKKGQAAEAGRLWAQIGLWGGIAATLISSVIALIFMFLSVIPVGF